MNIQSQSSLLSQLALKLSDAMSNKAMKIASHIKPFNIMGNGLSWNSSTKDSIYLDEALRHLKHDNICLLVTLDEVHLVDSLSEFITQYQIWVGSGLPIRLLFTGVPNQFNELKDIEGLTFLWRTPRLLLNCLSDSDIRLHFDAQFDLVDPLALQLMTNLASNYVFAFQVIGYFVWNASKGNHVTYDLVVDCLPQIKEFLYSKCYDRIYDEMTPQLQDFSIMLASLYQDVISTDAMVKNFQKNKSINVRRATVGRLRRQLINNLILKSDQRGKAEFSLPFFADFLRQING